MNALKIAAIAILGAIALFFGGCAGFFFFNDPQGQYRELQSFGAMIAVIAGIIIYVLVKSLDPPDGGHSP